MADQEIINVLLRLENPQVLDRVERLKSEQFQIKFSGSLDQGVKDILAIKDRKISITADVQGAMNSLKGIETTLKSLQNLKEIKLNLTGNISADLEKVSNEMNRLLLQAQKINTVGISNQKVSEYVNNPNLSQATASLSGQSSISQKQLEDSFLVTNFNQIKAKREAAQAAQREIFLRQIAEEEAQRARDAGATNRILQLDPFQKAQQTKLSAAKPIIAQAQAEDAVKRQAEFERAQELAKAQIREESLAKLRANAQGDFNSFFQEVQPAARKVAKKFDSNQIAAEEKRVAQLRELGQSAALGALQGQGALSVGGSLLGSLVGTSVPGGASFGGLVGGALGASAERTIESITRALEKASEAGLAFETSILGISSVLQATTRVSGPGGEALGLGDQLSFQQGQARSIQKLARTKLLPLGISGDKESTLVQSIISGAAQRGIQLTPEQAATLAERLGGAIQSQRPELLGNSGQLRRDVEDLFSGAPQNTVLKTLTKGFAPGLGKATSAEDLIRRSEGLASFPETLRSSTTNPVVAAQKLNSAVDNLNTTVGDALVTALIPGINNLAKELANPQLLEGVEKMGSAIGGVASFFVTASAGLIGLTTDAARLVTSIPGAAGGLIGVAARRAIGRGSTAENNLLELQEKKRGGLFTDQREIDAQIAAAQKEFDKENIKNKVTPKASVELAKALRGSGIDDLNTAAAPDLKSGFAVLASLEEASKQIRKETLEGIQDAESNNKDPKNLFSKVDVGARIKDLLSNETTQRLGLSLEKVGALRKAATDNQSLFDTSSPLGLVNKATDDVEGKSAIRAELENTVKLAEAKRAELKKDALPEDVKKANESVRAATYELIKARNDEREAVDQLKDAEIARTRALRDSQFDPRTFQGQAGLIQSGIQDAESRTNKAAGELGNLQDQLGFATNDTDRKNIQSRIEKAALEYNRGQVDQSALSAQAQNNVIGAAEGAFSAQKALFDFKQATEAAADKFAALADTIEGLNSKSAALTDQIAKSKRDLEDFDASKRLRELGREGNIIDAAERAYKSSEGRFGAENEISSKLPQELRSLIKGDFFFNQEARDKFESEKGVKNLDLTLLKNSPERFATEETETRNGILRTISDQERSKREIQRAKNAAEREQDALPFEDKERRFTLLKTLTGLNQAGADIGSEGQDAITAQAKALGIDLPAYKKAETLKFKEPENIDKIRNITAGGSISELIDLNRTALTGSTEDQLNRTAKEAGISQESIAAVASARNQVDQSESSVRDYITQGLPETLGDILKSLESIDKGIGELGTALKLEGAGASGGTPQGILSTFLGGPVGIDPSRITTGPKKSDIFKENGLFIEDEDPLKTITSGINDNPINFSDSLIARPSLPSRAYNPILREGLNEGLGNKADAKTNAVLEDVVGGFLDADVEGLKKQNRAPASGLKNGLFSGGLFGLSQESLKQDQGGLEATINTATDKIIQGIGNAFRSTINGI